MTHGSVSFFSFMRALGYEYDQMTKTFTLIERTGKDGEIESITLPELVKLGFEAIQEEDK